MHFKQIKQYIYNIKNKQFESSKKENYNQLLNIKPELLTNLLEKEFFFFYSFLNNIFIQKVYEYSNNNIKLNQIEPSIQYLGNNSSLTKYMDYLFLVGGKEKSGFYINKFEDNKNYAHIIPNKFAFECFCVTKDESIVSGESYNNQEFAIRRYQVIGRVCFKIDTILIEKDTSNNKLKGKINSILCLENNSILSVNGKGYITLYN